MHAVKNYTQVYYFGFKYFIHCFTCFLCFCCQINFCLLESLLRWSPLEWWKVPNFGWNQQVVNSQCMLMKAGICTKHWDLRDLLQRYLHQEKIFLLLLIDFTTRGQSYKDFYTQGQIYKHVLKHENNALAQTFVDCNVRTQHPNIFAGLHFSLPSKQQFRLIILHRPKV